MKRALLVCGVLYPLVWVVGLLVLMPDVSLDWSSEAIWQEVNGNGALGVQSLLVHGVAGVLLIAIASTAALLRLERTERRELGAIILWTGVVSGVVSLFQFVLEAVLVLGWFGASNSNARAIWLTISTIDGLKMLALAGFVLALGYVGGRELDFPAWAQALAVTAALALLVSGMGYTFSLDWALGAATLSLPLLLVSVAASSVLETRRHG